MWGIGTRMACILAALKRMSCGRHRGVLPRPLPSHKHREVEPAGASARHHAAVVSAITRAPSSTGSRHRRTGASCANLTATCANPDAIHDAETTAAAQKHDDAPGRTTECHSPTSQSPTSVRNADCQPPQRSIGPLPSASKNAHNSTSCFECRTL